MNFVVAIPTSTDEPISARAFLALSSLVPLCLMKFMPMWLQNSTPNPRLVTRLTTNTAFCSTGYPPKTILSSHIIPINSKKTRNTHAVIKTEISIELKIYKFQSQTKRNNLPESQGKQQSILGIRLARALQWYRCIDHSIRRRASSRRRLETGSRRCLKPASCRCYLWSQLRMREESALKCRCLSSYGFQPTLRWSLLATSGVSAGIGNE